MKKVIFAITAGLLSVTTVQANAADEKVIAIIDTEIDSSRFANIIHEVCIVADRSCNNKTNFEEGPGAANISDWKIKNAGHGHRVVYTLNQINSNIKVVFIRVAGTRYNVSAPTLPSVEDASKWIADNYAKYSIDAVSISLAPVIPGCRSSKKFDESVAKLSSANVAVFAAVGNDGNSKPIGWPACSTGVYSVGSLLGDERISPVSNGGSSAKIMARTCLSFKSPVHCNDVPDYFNIMRSTQGSSISTPIVSATLLSQWTGQPWSDLVASIAVKDGYKVVR